MFSILASDLHPKSEEIKMIKYADDTNLIIPQKKINSTEEQEELKHIKAWSTNNNLNLNHRKSKEIIFKRSRAKGEPGQLPDSKRVQEITLLGVSVNNKLQVTQHISTLIKKCNSTMYAIKILKCKGLECTKHIY